MTTADATTIPPGQNGRADLPPPVAGPVAGPLAPVLRRWPLVLAVTLACGAAGVVAARSQSPEFSAETQLNVGRIDVRVQALPGYVAGAASLATSYSRVVMSDRVVVPVARQLELPRSAVASRLVAVPVPENPIFRVIGRGPSAEAAIAMSAAATRQIEQFVARADTGREQLETALRDFRAQAGRAAELRRRLGKLKGQRRQASEPLSTVQAPSERELARVEVALETAGLRAESLRAIYANRQSELASTAGLEVISRPAGATSDASSRLQRAVAVGLLAGVLTGAALALLLDRFRRRGTAA